MADSILRLKVDSQEYDNKLKRAAEGLQRYADGCRKAGGTLTQLDDGVEDFVRELGKMETVSKSARGSINEMTKAFTDLSVQYNKLTDEEKNSPFGKALAQSLETLKGRIQDGNSELKNIGNSINDTGGFLNTLKDKFTVNIDALKLFNAGVTAAKAALDVAKDAFFASETNVDEWGRTVAAAEGVYDSFLQALNTGDFSGFLGHLDEIIKKAKDAYNALDELNTRMTIINPERTRLQARATELKAIIRRNGRDSEAGKAAQTELKQLEGMLTQAFKTESQLNMNAFKAQVDKKLQDAGIKLGERDYNFLMRTFSSDASYMAMRRGAKGSIETGYVAGGAYDEGQVYRQDTRNINQKLLDLFTDEWRKEYAPLLNAAFSARGGAASTMLSDARYLGGGGSGGGGGRGGGRNGGVSTEVTYAADSVAAQQAEVQRLTKLWNEAGADVRDQYLQPIIEAEAKLKQMREDFELAKQQASLKDSIAFPTEQAANDPAIVKKSDSWRDIADIPAFEGFTSPLTELENHLKELIELQNTFGRVSAEAWQGYQQQINETNQKINEFKGNGLDKDGKKIKSSWGDAASAISGVGSALNSIEDPTAKILGIVAQAIAGVAAGAGQAVSAKDTTSSGWAWIGAAAAITASMVAMISQIHSATGYANGGIVRAAGGTVVPGNNYSGDMVPAMLNSGELVLNRAQQGNLASQLEGGSMRNLQLSATIKGEDIRLVLNNNGRRTGRGEYVTTNFT